MDQRYSVWQDPTQNNQRAMQQNAIINQLNEFAALNPNNSGVQRAILEQYMNLMNPDYENELARAFNIMQMGSELGDESLVNAGRGMLQQNPLLSQYLQQSQAQQPQQNMAQDLYAQQFATEFAPTQEMGIEDQLKNLQYMQQVKQSPALAQQYYKTDVNPMETFSSVMGQTPLMEQASFFSGGLGGGLGALLNNLMRNYGPTEQNLRLNKTFGQ